MSFLTQSDLDLVQETRASVEEQFKERVLDAIAVAHHDAHTLSCRAIKDGSKGDAGGMLAGMAASTLIMETAASGAIAIAEQMGFSLEELQPAAMKARYARLKAEGKVPV